MPAWKCICRRCDDIDFDVDSQSFHMDRNETIHTENSHKYGPRDARLLLRAGGWSPIAEWTDEKELFCADPGRGTSA